MQSSEGKNNMAYSYMTLKELKPLAKSGDEKAAHELYKRSLGFKRNTTTYTGLSK